MSTQSLRALFHGGNDMDHGSIPENPEVPRLEGECDNVTTVSHPSHGYVNTEPPRSFSWREWHRSRFDSVTHPLEKLVRVCSWSLPTLLRMASEEAEKEGGAA